MSLDATLAGASSNSYITLAEAETFSSQFYNLTAWSTATSGNQEAALMEACTEIESYRLRFNPSISTQALHFPRDIDYDSTGVYIIPTAIKKVQFLIAVNILETRSMEQKAQELKNAGVSSYSLGDYSVSFGNVGTGGKYTSLIRKLLYPYIEWEGRVGRSTYATPAQQIFGDY